jgi:protein TonB
MGSYSGRVDGKGRASAIAGVALVHVALAAIILSGLNVDTVRRAIETVTTLDVIQPPKPTPPPPPHELVRTPKAPKESGQAGKHAEPTPVVAPESKLPVPSLIPAAKIAGAGNESSSGTAASGSGTGAGGTGLGSGGGGAGFTPARRISKIPDSAYRQLAATGIPSGSVGVTIKVETDGNVSNCRIVRSSGDRAADSLMCNLTIRYVRFEPARDPNGRPVAQDITFFPNWWRP